MSKFSSHQPGAFSWVDLVAHDMDTASGWYSDLFGWSANRQDTQGGPPYAQFALDGRTVAGVGQMSVDMKGQGIPAMWNSYITVEDAAATQAQAEALGATITVPTMQVMESGRLMYFTDPQGAQLAVWEPIHHHGAQVCNEPGSLTWNELATSDIDAASEFYRALFGWTFSELPGPTKVLTIENDGRPNGHMLQMNEAWAGIPPNWMPYFAVADTDAMAQKAEDAGGKICSPPTDIPPGRFAVIQDPEGATFTIIRLSDPAD